MTAEPLGPALAAELGGTWDAMSRTVHIGHEQIGVDAFGAVWLETDDARLRLGSFSDGAAALARRARRLGVA